jgi:heme/copper-type cytochrome/quinol oxidase subunit 2
MNIKDKIKKIKKIFITIIFTISCWVGISGFFFLCAFTLIAIIGNGGNCSSNNGICEMSKSMDAYIFSTIIPIFIISIPITYFLYSKHRNGFNLIAILSFIVGILILLYG